MAEINVIDWHIHPFRVDRWYEAWMPAFEWAQAFGATEADDDPLRGSPPVQADHRLGEP